MTCASADELADSETMMTSRPTVLVIDDEMVLRNLFREVLEEWGYAADTAASGEAGLQLIRQKHYAVVLTDYLMPGMNGYEVALTVRREKPATAVILITGSATDTQLAAAVRSNMTVLCKPVPLAELKVAVDRAVSAA